MADGRRPAVVGGGGFFTIVDMPVYWQFDRSLTEEVYTIGESQLIIVRSYLLPWC